MPTFMVLIPDIVRAGNGNAQFLAATAVRKVLKPHSVQALAYTFVRLTEGAFLHYERGRAILLDYYERYALTFELRIAASLYFETCISDAWRAMRCAQALRSQKDVPQSVKDAIPRELSFVMKGAESQMRGMRNMLQHLESDILAGKLTESHDLMLLPTGPLTDAQGDTVREIDRLRLGDAEILFSDLALWLNDMSRCVRAISDVMLAMPWPDPPKRKAATT